MFDITDGKNVLGQLKATRTISAGRTVVEVNSETKITRLVTITIRFSGRIEYEGGRMVKSTNRTDVNGYNRSETELEWKGDHYFIKVDGDEKRLTDKIRYSGSMMYFIEPEYYGTVFSEKFGEFDPIIRLEEGHYVVQKGDGTRHTYTYRNGKLQTIEYPHSLMDITIRRRP